MSTTPVRDELDAALRLRDVRPEPTFDVPPQWCGWCAFPRRVAVGVTWALFDPPGELIHADACQACAPELIRFAHELSPEGHAVVVAVISADE